MRPLTVINRFEISAIISLITSIVCLTSDTVAKENTTTTDYHQNVKFDDDGCSKDYYTSDCFLADMNKLMDDPEEVPLFVIRPGVYISIGGGSNRILNRTTANSNTSDDLTIGYTKKVNYSPATTTISAYRGKIIADAMKVRLIIDKLKSYLRTLTLTINVADCKYFVKSKNISGPEFLNILLTAYYNDSNEIEARSKKGGHSKKTALWAAATMAAIGGSALFAVTGKAAAASLAALLLGLLCLMKGHGHHGHYTTAHVSAAPIIDTSGFLVESTGEAYVDSSRSNFKRYKYVPKYVIDDRNDDQQAQPLSPDYYKYYHHYHHHLNNSNLPILRVENRS